MPCEAYVFDSYTECLNHRTNLRQYLRRSWLDHRSTEYDSNQPLTPVDPATSTVNYVVLSKTTESWNRRHIVLATNTARLTLTAISFTALRIVAVSTAIVTFDCSVGSHCFVGDKICTVVEVVVVVRRQTSPSFGRMAPTNCFEAIVFDRRTTKTKSLIWMRIRDTMGDFPGRRVDDMFI